jgi:hypothetical protein
MALSKKHQAIVERARRDPKFRLELLKELIRMAVRADPELLDRALEKIESK